MMNKPIAFAAVLACGNVVAAAPPTQNPPPRPTMGDVLLIEQVHKEHGLTLPARGMSMAQVQKRFGAPLKKLDVRGGGSAAQPPINRWEYKDYIVYFERNHVIHAVINPPPGNPGF